MIIADDERIIRESLATMIDWNALGVEVVAVCKTGIEVLDSLMDSSPDIVLTDIRMPGMDGLELIERIQSMDSQIHFILISSHRDFDYAHKAMQCGVQHYLVKPIVENELIKAVSQVCSECEKTKGLGAVHQSIHVLGKELYAKSKAVKKNECASFLIKQLENVNNPELLRSYSAELLAVIYHLVCDSRLRAGIFDEIYLEKNHQKIKEMVVENVIQLLYQQEMSSNGLSQKVMECVYNNLNEPQLSIKWIAQNILFMNAAYLCHQFNLETGMKFSVYVNELRINKAKEMLKQFDNGQISKIAQSVGFGENTRYFSSVFKKYTGMTPSEFQRMQKAAEDKQK